MHTEPHFEPFTLLVAEPDCTYPFDDEDKAFIYFGDILNYRWLCVVAGESTGKVYSLVPKHKMRAL